MPILTMLVNFFASAFRLSATFLFGSTGEILTEKSGHLNLGTPGTMCVGALCGLAGEYAYIEMLPNSSAMNGFLAVIIPIITAFLGAGLMGLIYSFFTVTLRANQNITGLALTTFGIGLSKYFVEKIRLDSFGMPIPYSKASTFFTRSLPFADSLGGFGKVFLSHGVMVYLAIIVAILVTVILNRTRLGLHLRAVGENPATADAAGISVSTYRYWATIVGSGIAGLGGMTFIMDYLGGNWEYVIDAMGWLCVALVIFTLWNPSLSILGSFCFACLYIISVYFTIPISSRIVDMAPYVMTIIILVFTSIINFGGSQPPAGLGLNYFREER